MMNKWKRILAAAGTAALLVSNLGSVRQTAFATENPVDGVETQETGSTDNTNTSELEESSDANVLTLDASELIGNVLGTDPQPVADPEPEPSTEEPVASDDEEPDKDQDDGETAEKPSEEPGEETQPTDPAAKSDQPADAPANPDETTVVPGEETSEETGNTTLEPTDEVPEEPTEDPDEESADDEDEIALSDSIDVTLGTRESSKLDPAIDENGTYLYNLGETASTTVTIENPEGYEITEDDGAVIRVYMQFSDAIADETDAIPYKEEGQVNEDVAAANVADLISETAVASLSDTETTDAADDAEPSEEDAADETTTAETKRAEQYNGSYGRTAKAGEHTVTTESGTSYQYTITELGDGIYCYEFSRPLNGEHYSVELTSSYAVDSIGGTNDIWAVVLSAEDRAELDGYELAETSTEDADAQDDDSDADDENTQDEADAEDEADDQDHHDGQVRVAARPEDDDLYQTLKWGSSASFVIKETTRTAETENYTVAVTYGPDSQIPAEATLSVTEYGPETEVYQRITEQTGETYDWLLDISFYYNELPLEPQAPIGIKVTAKATTVEDSSEETDEDEISTASLDEEDTENSEDVSLENTITTITHFADDGTEVIENDDVEVAANDEGQVEMTFELTSLSLVAGTTYKTATVISSSGYSSGKGYLIYKLYNNEVYFLANLSDSPVTFKVAVSDLTNDGQLNGIETLNATNYFKNTIKGSVMNSDGSSYAATLNFSNLVWTNTNGYLTNNGKYLKLGYQLSLVSQSNATGISATISVEQGSESKYVHIISNYITGSHTEIRWFGLIPIPTEVYDYTKYQLYFDSYQNEWIKANTASWSDYTMAVVGDDYEKKDTSQTTGGKDAVYTGDIDDMPLGFYNVQVKTDSSTGKKDIEPLAGVTYTIYDENDKIVGAVVSTDDLRVSLDTLDLQPGKYKMKMTGVPDGFVCDNDIWRFEVTGENGEILNLRNKDGKGDLEGIIVVNPIGNIKMGKTASQYDYANRVYQVDLTAHSNIQEAKIDSLHINFVVDQSNSMLFPSGLKDTGKTITIRGYRNEKNNGWANWQALTGGFNKLDKNRVYYIIVQQTTSSTVMAIWWNGEAWCYQDASYYAKAYYANSSYKDTYDPSKIKTSDKVTYPNGEYIGDDSKGCVAGGYFFKDASNKYDIGGSIKSDLQDSKEHASYNYQQDGNTKYADISFTVYTATNEYNRLHYLEESLTQMLEMLGTMCPDATVTLDTFYWEPKECSKTKNNGTDYVLGNNYNGETGLRRLLDMVGDITTGGGTRQDKALKHVYENHIGNDTCENKYVVLITDGAPAGSGTIVGATASVGDGNVDGTSSSNDVYMQVNYWAQQVKNSATLATVGLSMSNVKSGSIAMRYISSDYDQFNSTQFGYATNKLDKNGDRYADGYVNGSYSPTHGNWWYQPDDSSELTKILCEDIMEQIVATSTVNDDPGQVTDYISDSFYPVDKEVAYKALESGTRINLDGTACKDDNGNYIKDDSSKGKGTVLQDGETKSWYVKWDEMSLSGSTTTSQTKDVWEKGDTWRHSRRDEYDSYTRDGKTYTWQYHDGGYAYWYHTTETVDTTTKNEFKGTIYIKAKEDYIGGNGIETNGNLMSKNEDGEYTSATLKMKYGGTMEYDMPSVNVRLLEMTQETSKVTVLKGDNINSDTVGPESSVKIFFDDVSFGKLVSGTDDVTNKVGAKELGVGENAFSLGYSGVTLTDDQWTALKNGGEIKIPYSYRDKDGNSRDGAVGYFTISLAKESVEGQTADWGVHPATVAKGDAQSETYPYGDNWIERYTLNVTYTAYKLGEEGRPATTKYNGTPGAGTMVDPAITSGVTNGQGIVKSTNIHYVYALETYELPDTGGMGTLPLELGGFAAMLGSMFVGYSRRRRHRKEGEM